MSAKNIGDNVRSKCLQKTSEIMSRSTINVADVFSETHLLNNEGLQKTSEIMSARNVRKIGDTVTRVCKKYFLVILSAQQRQRMFAGYFSDKCL